MVVDIESKFKSIKASWVSRLLSSDLFIRKFVDDMCNKVGLDTDYIIIKSNLTEKRYYDSIPRLPQFYKEVFCAFNQCKENVCIDKLSCDTFLSQNIWLSCLSCHCMVEDSEHLIFNCQNVKNLWNIVGNIINCNIRWKHIDFILKEIEKLKF